MKINKSAFSILLLILLIVEILCNTTWIFHNNKYIVSIIYFICGLAIGILPLVKVKESSSLNFNLKYQSYLLFAGSITITAFILINAPPLFLKIPIDYRTADMLPIIDIMCQRFLDGEKVYEKIPEIWDGMQPIYLPAMWAPYIPATWLNLDLRWISCILLIFALLITVFGSNSIKNIGKNTFVTLIPVGLLTWGVIKEDFILIPMTEELVVVFYYVLLGFAIHKQKIFLIAVALVLCALSRYSLVPWAIMYIIYSFMQLGKKKALLIGSSSLILGVILMLVFQGFSNLSVFINLQNDYLNAIIESRDYYENVVNSSLGLAKLLDYNHLNKLHYIHLISSFIIPFTLLLIFIKFKSKLNQSFFALCSLKLSMVFFYNLLIVPYLYLFYTSTFLSILLISFYINKNVSFEKLKISNT